MTPLTIGTVGVLATVATLGSLGPLGLSGSTASPAPTAALSAPEDVVPGPLSSAAGRPAGSSWPIPGAAVLTEFDDPPTYAPGHRGLDLQASVGQTVVAALDGQVTVAGNVAGRPVVVIHHRTGVRSTYLPVDPVVRVGEVVAAGEPIGHLALTTPLHCVSAAGAPAACLHWGARDGDRYLDPRGLLGGNVGPIVLLPLEPANTGPTVD